MNHKKLIIGLLVILVIVGALNLISRTSNGSKTATSTPESMIIESPTALTLAENGKTAVFKKGDRFALSLGEMAWTLSISNKNIVSRVKNIATMRGSQGVYTADNVGTTTISAEGRPICKQGEMCAQYIVSWSANIEVR